MHCNRVKLENGTTAIVCGRGRRAERCRWCAHTPGEFQCDWKVGKGRTCDKHLCAQHAKEVAPNKHLCPEHQKTYEQWLAERTKKTAPPEATKPQAPPSSGERKTVALQHTKALKQKLRGAP